MGCFWPASHCALEAYRPLSFLPRQARWDICPFPSLSLCRPAALTEVFGGGAVFSVDNDQPWPQDLQGGHVGRQDTKGPRLRGHIHLPDVGAIEENLKSLKEWVTASQAHTIGDSTPSPLQ